MTGRATQTVASTQNGEQSIDEDGSDPSRIGEEEADSRRHDEENRRKQQPNNPGSIKTKIDQKKGYKWYV
jgi:hypothetical protein